jgi:hypothetical protein
MARTINEPTVPGGRRSLENGNNGRTAGTGIAGARGGPGSVVPGGRKMKNTARKSTGGKAPRHSGGECNFLPKPGER